MIRKSIILFLFLLLSRPVDVFAEYVITYIRDGALWVRGGTGDSVRVVWQDYYGGDRSVNYIYFQGPDGSVLDRIFLDYNDPGGEVIYDLNEGFGDYRIEFPGYFYRIAQVTAQGAAQLVFEPACGHRAYHPNGVPLYFNVPSGLLSFTLCGKYNIGTTGIRLYRPDGEYYDTLMLVDDPATLYFDRMEVNDPEAGTWRIEFEGDGKVGFWLDGAPNYFAPAAESLFEPEPSPGTAVFEGEGETGEMGLIGASLVNLGYPDEIFENIEYMGLETFNYYNNIYWREPYNPSFPFGGDNDDPHLFDWSWYVWDDARISWYREDLGAQISSLFDAKESWLGPPLESWQQEEFAEFALAYLIHANADQQYGMKWFSPWDEPNLSVFTYEEYEALLLEMAGRIKDPANPPEVINTPLMAVSSSGWENCNTGPERIGRLWAENLYFNYDHLVDGIAFDHWEFRDLIESWRFGNSVNIAADIIRANDTDGDADEEIVINQTSMSSGSGSSAYDVNSHFSALWLTGAICSAFSKAELDAFHYFTTVDDNRHMKGLMYSENPPEPLPYRPQAQPYQLKPMGHAMAMINEAVLDEILITESDSVEVNALLTTDETNTSAALIAVNKFPRINLLILDAVLPAEMKNKCYKVTGECLGPQDESPEPLQDSLAICADDTLHFEYELNPETVYAFRFSIFTPELPAMRKEAAIPVIICFSIGIRTFCRRRKTIKP